MGHYGAQWGVMGCNGALWGAMGRYGVQWGAMGCSVGHHGAQQGKIWGTKGRGAGWEAMGQEVSMGQGVAMGQGSPIGQGSPHNKPAARSTHRKNPAARSTHSTTCLVLFPLKSPNLVQTPPNPTPTASARPPQFLGQIWPKISLFAPHFSPFSTSCKRYG